MSRHEQEEQKSSVHTFKGKAEKHKCFSFGQTLLWPWKWVKVTNLVSPCKAWQWRLWSCKVWKIYHLTHSENKLTLKCSPSPEMHPFSHWSACQSHEGHKQHYIWDLVHVRNNYTKFKPDWIRNDQEIQLLLSTVRHCQCHALETINSVKVTESIKDR